MQLKDTNHLITGGSSGIGKATAELLIAKGARVAITGRDPMKLARVAEAMGAHAIHADVAKESDVKRTYVEFLERFERLDGLVNNAGIGGGWAPIDELNMEAMRQVYDVNVFGAAMMGQEAAAIFKKQNSGCLINIASTAALKGYAKGTVYSSSKWALRGMTQCWQADLRPHNVAVTLVNPSEVATAFGAENREERTAAHNKLRSEEIAHAIVAAMEMDPRGFIPELAVFATNPW
ncbi:MAG: SDR family NAD(P)-dependent oxidoreductase [Planctomycetota bacterium]|nr:SDR family NAD(P)-dependent oxidoreductase [Planctomycetota bacterium]